MKKNRNIAILIFVIYILALFYYLFFAGSMGRTCRGEDFRYNIKPFFEITRIWRNREALGMRYVIINLLGNILAFAPFGYLLPKIVTRMLGVFYTVLFTLEFSVFVELIQLVTRTGSFDVDDLILNTIGGLVGYILYYRRLISGKK